MHRRRPSAVLGGSIGGLLWVTAASGQTVFINEIHYDNAGADIGEAVEIAGPAGTDLQGWSLVLYNGAASIRAPYDTVALSGSIDDEVAGLGARSFPTTGLQNGGPDGLALVDRTGTVHQFLSYEGSFEAASGPAAGLTSTDIGVAETSGTPVGWSLQLSGMGTVATDFSWTGPAAASFGRLNAGQTGSEPPVVDARVYEVQGDGRVSPLVGETVRVEGVVTGDFQDGAFGTDGDLNGFYLQDARGDGNPTTSDGIFVFDGASPTVDVAPGDAVEVEGTVTEFFGETQIAAASVRVVGTGAVEPTRVRLPAANVVLNADGENIADLEAYEGMLVRFRQRLVVTELFQLDRFGEVRLARRGRLFQFTNRNLPDPTGFAAHREKIAKNTLTLDDGRTVQNPDPIRYPAPGLSTENPVRMGDRVRNLVGNLRFSRGSGGSGDETYRLMPVVEPRFVAKNRRRPAPHVRGRLKVASFNVLNFFNDLDDGTGRCFPTLVNDRDCRGADRIEEFNRQQEKLVTALAAIDADIFGLIELENDIVDGPAGALATLTAALNARGTRRCGSRFDYVNTAERAGGDAIAVGLMFCTRSVELAPGTVPAVLTDAALPGLGLDPGPVFDGFATNRAPVAATFQTRRRGAALTVMVNHFKSKGASGLDEDPVCQADPPANPNCDQGDGQGFWNARRTRAAEAIAAWARTQPTGTDDPDVLILGDLNAYLREDPIRQLEAAGFENLVATRGRGPLYSFVFDAQAGVLDYAFASRTLSRQVRGVAVWHANADEADALDYNLDFGRNPALFDGARPFRSSDHDPIIVGLRLATRHRRGW